MKDCKTAVYDLSFQFLAIFISPNKEKRLHVRLANTLKMSHRLGFRVQDYATAAVMNPNYVNFVLNEFVDP